MQSEGASTQLSPGSGIINAVVQNKYAEQQAEKVRQLQDRIYQFSRKHKNVNPDDIMPMR